jgi:hypothetical protein
MGSLVSAREARQLRRRARRQAMPRMVTWTALLGLGLLAVHLGWYSSESGGTRPCSSHCTVPFHASNHSGCHQTVPAPRVQ